MTSGRSWSGWPSASSDSPSRLPPTGSRRCKELPAPPLSGKLEAELQRSVQVAVQEGFEGFRQAEADRVEDAWSALAERFRARTEARVNRVRAAAADLFTVSLPAVAVPEVSGEREQFFDLFLHIDPLGEELLRVLRRLLPPRFRRRRLLTRLAASWTASSTSTPAVRVGTSLNVSTRSVGDSRWP